MFGYVFIKLPSKYFTSGVTYFTAQLRLYTLEKVSSQNGKLDDAIQIYSTTRRTVIDDAIMANSTWIGTSSVVSFQTVFRVAVAALQNQNKRRKHTWCRSSDSFTPPPAVPVINK